MASRRLILVVEDDDGLRRLMETALREAGYPVMVAATIRQALASPVVPELVLADVRLPDGDGRSLCKHWQGVPCLTMSGLGEADLRKPFTMRELLARLDEW